MELSEYIKLVLLELPEKTRVSFDIAISVKKGKLYFDNGGYNTNKIKFTVVKPGKEITNGIHE